MDRRFLGILGAIIIIFIGIFAISQNSNDKNSSGSGAKAQPTNHVTGQGQKHVTLVEYGDYQCPICESYYLPVKQVVAQFNQAIYFQFRNLPLSQIHQNSFAGARAAEAAGLQNKYWQMHDMLYEQNNWQQWTNSNNPSQFFNDYAKQLGLNVEQFKKDYASDKVNDAVNADLAAFKKTGQQQATPTFFLDGQYIDNTKVSGSNGPSVSKFAAVINAEIAKRNP